MIVWPVRGARPSDAEGIASLLSEVAQESPLALLGGSILETPSVSELLARPSDRFVILVSGPGAPVLGIVGVLILVRGPAQSDHTANLSVSVAASHRHQGVARALLDGATWWAAAHGVLRLTASVVEGNAGSLAFFRSCGFVQEGIRPGQIRVLGRDRDEILFGFRVHAPELPCDAGRPVPATEGRRRR